LTTKKDSREHLADLIEDWKKRLQRALDWHFEIPSTGNGEVAKIIWEMDEIVKTERTLSWKPENTSGINALMDKLKADPRYRPEKPD